MQDLEMLAVIYGVQISDLLRAPGDKETPELLRQAYEIITQRDRAAVRNWLASGAGLRDREEKEPPP